jgi:hypothetical protein
MKMRVLPLLLALLLGGATAFVVSCGGDRSGLIPASNAGTLTSALDQVAAATKAGECEKAGQALSRAQGAVIRLPASVDPRLKRRLQSGIDNLRKRIPDDCQQTTSTAAPTTTEAPTTTAAPTQTETTQTETTQTDTAPTDTTTPPPDTTSTPTTPGDTSGGVTVP